MPDTMPDTAPDTTSGDAAAGPDASMDSAAPDADDGGRLPDADAGVIVDAGPCAVLGPSGEPTDLACTGLYSDWTTKTVTPGVVQYTPGLQLWSDGAVKTRWIQLPPGQPIDTSNMDEWTFPNGTKIWKEFRLPAFDSATPLRIETRLLWKLGPNNWVRTTYRWSDDGETSATELLNGELDANGAGYEVPSQFECNDCHNGRLDGVLGFEAVALSAPGASGWTLPELVEAGVVTAAPAGQLTVPGDPIESAALGWMHMNCGTACHNGGQGEAESSGFFLRLDVATLGSVASTEAYTTGWNVPSTTFHIPDAGTTYRFHACDLGSSAAYVRADVRAGVDGTPYGIQMPPIDSHVVDVAGVAELAAWISEGCDGG
jgi:hypothetical protein